MRTQLPVSIVLVASLAGTAFGQVNFSGTYSQNFDGLNQTTGFTNTLTGRGPHLISAGLTGSTGMEGWFGANFFGSSTNTEFKAQDGSLGSGAGRGVISFGANGSSDRALGALPTSNQIPSFGIVLFNASSDTYQALDVSFIGEQWRAGGPSIPNVLEFSHGSGASLDHTLTTFADHAALNFAAPNQAGGEIALNGNDAINQALLGSTITGLNWAPGQSLVLRWDLADLSGQDNGLGIDNLSLTGIVPAPGAFGLLGMAAVVGGRRRRRDRR